MKLLIQRLANFKLFIQSVYITFFEDAMRMKEIEYLGKCRLARVIVRHDGTRRRKFGVQSWDNVRRVA